MTPRDALWLTLGALAYPLGRLVANWKLRTYIG